jgi:hypothetical protein
VVHDFLSRLVGPRLAEQVLATGGRWYAPPPGQAGIRWSSPTRPSATATARSAKPPGSSAAAPNCRSSRTSSGSGRRVDPALLFDLPGHPPAQRAKRIDGRLPSSLIALPEQITGAVDVPAHRSLAVRDLLRGEITGLPSGETVARHLGVTPSPTHFRPHGTPLWSYILD